MNTNKLKKILLGLTAIAIIGCSSGGSSSSGSSSNFTPSGSGSGSNSAGGTGSSSSSGSSSNYYYKETYSDTYYNGTGVKIGIVDIGFNNSYLSNKYSSQFKKNFSEIDIHGTSTSNDERGWIVSQLIRKYAKNTSLIVSDLGVQKNGLTYINGYDLHNIYSELNKKNINIYAQSWGNQGLYGYIDYSTHKDFESAIKNGALFIWSAGNNEYSVSDLAKMPYTYPELEKGWINVVGLDENTAMAKAGNAKNWTISSNGKYKLNDGTIIKGSGYAIPAVVATAARIKEKYPFMDGNLIRQTILSTATDIGATGVDSTYGWGKLNVQKALKGPARFDKRLALADNVTVNIPHGAYIFSNNISGEAGLIKDGSGTLILSGSNSYYGSTKIKNGTLELYSTNTSNITIKSPGTLVLTPTTVIGTTSYPKDVKNEGGTLENRGSGAVITGNYEATAGSVTKAQIGSKLIVKGTVNLNGGNATLQTLSNGRYITAKPLSSTVIEAEKGINGSFDKVETPELINGAVETADNKVNVKLSRKNMVDYVEKIAESDEMQKNTAENLETAFQKLDQNIENGTAGNVAQFERKAAKLQALTSSNRAAVLDSLSGQIYASAQALTFQHSQTVNKDLSNRLVMLGTLDNVGDNFGLWISGFGANGKLKQDGYGKGDTKVAGGQVGVDKQFGENLILGTALSYSKADVKFDRYGGKSDANNFGVSLYGRLGNKNVPFYLQGRFGIGFVDSDVERDIILSNNDFTRAKINHNDKVYSGYLETGYDIKNDNGDFVVTPFVGLTHDTVVRGSFSEEKSQFGLTADKKNYNQTAALLGLRVGKAVNWNGGSKTTFQGYVTHQRAFNDQDLSFDARYTGLPGATFKVKGIGLSKNRTWVGVGALTEVNSGFGWYVNYDGSIDSGKGKGNNNVFTTGLRFNF
ncbi:autotransporter domain-containing protein [Leptotrichia trevisanii]